MLLKLLTSSLFRNARPPCCSSGIVQVRYMSTIDYSPKCDGLSIEPKDKVLWIRFDRAKKYNAITKEMYEKLTETFTKVNGDKDIKAVVLTGNGDYYSSGNDLTNFVRASQDESGIRAGLTKSKVILQNFVDSLINLEKLMIAAVNGPAVGIPVTTLPLCDYVIASDRSTFQSPFTALGQCPEACSSLTMPKMFGPTRASELLLLNMTWNAKKAHNYGLVSEVIEHEKFHEHLENLLYGKLGIVNTCYPHSLKVSKSLTRDPVTKQQLLEANKRECEEILELWLGEECTDAVQKFLTRMKK